MSDRTTRSDRWPDDAEEDRAAPVRALTRQEAQALREKQPPVSPWRVVLSQAVVGVLVVLARAVRSLDRRASVAIHSAFGAQVLLGIATVWSGTAIWLAALHQLTGALLVVASVWGVHTLATKNA